MELASQKKSGAPKLDSETAGYECELESDEDSNSKDELHEEVDETKEEGAQAKCGCDRWTFCEQCVERIVPYFGSSGLESDCGSSDLESDCDCEEWNPDCEVCNPPTSSEEYEEEDDVYEEDEQVIRLCLPLCSECFIAHVELSISKQV